MGLDITYYKNIKPITSPFFNEDGEPIDSNQSRIDYDGQIYINPDFQERADDLVDRQYFTAEDSDGFRAGSYSGYNRWREMLAELGGYSPAPYEQFGTITQRFDAGAWNAGEGPFFELIHMSDCEGVIGPKTSAKLAQDFSDFQNGADLHPDDQFKERYNEWRAAFETARNNGLVSFH